MRYLFDLVWVFSGKLRFTNEDRRVLSIRAPRDADHKRFTGPIYTAVTRFTITQTCAFSKTRMLYSVYERIVQEEEVRSESEFEDRRVTISEGTSGPLQSENGRAAFQKPAANDS